METALFRLQSYYSVANKYFGDFADGLKNALTEFDTAGRDQLARDSVKPDFFRLSLSGRALAYYNSIHATRLKRRKVQFKFREQFMSRTKQTDISAELDGLNIAAIRVDDDSDCQPLDMLMGSLEELSLVGTCDDSKDDEIIRRLHNAIVQEKRTYFALFKLCVVYSYE